MNEGQLTTAAWRRFLRLGGLAGRVGASLLGERVRDLARFDLSRQNRKSENLVKNAARVVETLAELKGAAMKVGQMLSLHVGLLPPEVAAVLRTLQKEAPSVPFEVIRYEIEGQLPDFDRLFVHLERRAFAAASIGQVHRARLWDGRRVAVKIQYPEIERIIRADLKNLRFVLENLFALLASIDFEPIWLELHDRLLEELDYTHEADSMRRMSELHAAVPEIIVPAVVDEASTRRILTMEYVEGIAPQRAATEEFDQRLKNRWGEVLFEFQYRGLFKHRLLHADPNLANFAFRDDGRIVVYDFGCVKRIPESLAQGYASLFLAALEGRKQDVPRILQAMGVGKDGGLNLPRVLTDPYVDLFGEILRAEPPYTFGEDQEFYEKLIEIGKSELSEARGIRFPRDMVFIHRALAGHFGNLSRLRASARWRDLALKYVAAAGGR